MSYSPWHLHTPTAFSPKRALFYDSEFVRERHYYPKLALVQLYQADWQAVQLADPMMQDLTPLWVQIAAHDAPLVMHAALQDLELLWTIAGVLPQQVRDTQIGFALCYPHKAVSYADMVQHYLGILLPKSETRSDWLARPLSAAQCDYAADDVALLGQVYPLLCADLQALGRLAWWQEECAALLSHTRQEAAALAWYQLRSAPQQLKATHHAAAQALVDRREQIAAALDKPRRKILSDEQLIATARRCPENAWEVAELLPPEHLLLEDMDALNAAFALYREQSPPQPKRNLRLSAAEQKRFQQLEKYTHRLAAELNISDDTLATPKQLREWLKNPEQAALNTGWRAAFFHNLRI